MLRTLVTAGLVLTLGGVAQAARIAAGPMLVGNGQRLQCNVVNVTDTKTVTVAVTAVCDNTAAPGPVTLAPQADFPVTDFNGAGFAVRGYCLFDIAGSKSAVRATACVLDSNFNCIAAVQAQ